MKWSKLCLIFEGQSKRIDSILGWAQKVWQARSDKRDDEDAKAKRNEGPIQRAKDNRHTGNTDQDFFIGCSRRLWNGEQGNLSG
jgi:hypothetical protein